MTAFTWVDDSRLEATALGHLVGQVRRIIPSLKNAPADGVVHAGISELIATGALQSSLINVKAEPYNAVGDGVADDTTAMRAAHATGNRVYYPAGTYLFSTVPGIVSGGIRGDGPSATVLSSTDTTAAAMALVRPAKSSATPSPTVL